jgi:CheY-like chemotaxis protein
MHVLLVDDHMDTRAVCAAVITNLGHTVEAVPTIAAALAAAARSRFDLLVCDILLPDGIGYDLMRDLSRRYGLRGIALTGCRLQRDVDQSRAAGFVCHLAKPVDLGVLAEVIHGLTPATTGQAAVAALAADSPSRSVGMIAPAV